MSNAHDFLNLQHPLFSAITQAVIATTLDGQILFWNSAAEKMYGWTADEVIGRSIVEVTPSSLSQEQAEAIMAQLRRGESWAGEFLVRHKDGQLFMASVTDTPLVNADGTLAGIIGLSTPVEPSPVLADRLPQFTPERFVSSQPKAELIAQSYGATLFSHVFALSPVATMISVLETGVIREANAAFAQLIDLRLEDIIGASAASLGLWARPEDQATLMAAIEQDCKLPLTKMQVKRHSGALANVYVAAELAQVNSETLLLTFLLDAMQDESAQRAAQENEKRLYTLIEAVPIPVLVTRLRDGVVLLANDYARRIFALRGNLSEVRAANFYARLEVRDPMIAELKRTGRIEGFEIEVRRGDGTTGWSLSSMSMMRYDGEDVGIAIFHDITERKLNEDKLRHLSQRLELLHEIDQSILAGQAPAIVSQHVLEHVAEILPYAQGAVFTIDPAGQSLSVIALSGTFINAFTVGNQYPLNNPLAYYALVHTGEYAVEDTYALENATQLQQQRTEDGIRSLLMVDLRVADKVIGAITLGFSDVAAFTDTHRATLRDVADQLAIAFESYRFLSEAQAYSDGLEARVAERTQVINQAKDQIEVLLNGTADAIMAIDSSGVVEQTNPGFHHLFGYSGVDMIGQSVFSLFLDEDALHLRDALDLVLLHNSTESCEAIAHDRDSQPVSVVVTLTPITRSPLTSGVSAICTIRDITWLKQAEADLRQSLTREREVNALRSRFVSMISHEFRTPLASIQSSSDLLKNYREKLSGERQNEYLDQIQAEITQLVTLLDDVLTINRADAIHLQFDPLEIDLVELCRSIVDETRYALAREHSVDFRSSVEHVVVPLDLQLMRQAIGNLLSNAIKYSPVGTSVHCELELQENSILIHIRDEGIGIPEEDQARLFETFQRASNVGDIQGTGLGLAIVKRAIEAHGGTIKVESKEGEGTTFTITLPKISRTNVDG